MKNSFYNVYFFGKVNLKKK